MARSSKRRRDVPPADGRSAATAQPPPRGASVIRSGPGLVHVAAGLALLVTATFSNSLPCSLAVLDNEPIILRDTRIREATWSNLWLIVTTDYWFPTLHSDLYRPLTTLSYLVDHSVVGNRDNPVGYHLVNMLLHAGNATMVYALLAAILRHRWAAAAVAAVFAVHPLTTEAVTNVVGRADLLATAGVLGALMCMQVGDGRRGAARIASLAGLALCTAAAALSKESGFAIGLVVPLRELVVVRGATSDAGDRPEWLERFRRAGGLRWLVVVMVLVACIAVRREVLRDSPAAGQVAIDNPISVAPPFAGRMTAVHVLGRYLALAVWPATLSCDYSYNQIPIFSGTLLRHGDWQAWLALGMLVTLVAVGLAAFRLDPALFFCLAFAASMIAPAANLFFCTGTIMAERVMYPSLIGLLGAIGCGLRAGYARAAGQLHGPWSRLLPVAACGTVALLVAAGAVRAHARNRDWLDAESLWASALDACPGSHKVHKGVAEARFRRLLVTEAIEPPPRTDFHADMFRAEILDRAAMGLQIYDAAPLGLVHEPVRLLVDLMRYHLELGDRIALQSGLEPGVECARAREWYERGAGLGRRAVEADRAMNAAWREASRRRGSPRRTIFDIGNPEVHRTHGELLMRLGRWRDALVALDDARHLAPGEASTHLLRGRCLVRDGRREQACVASLESLWVGDAAEREAALAELAGLYGEGDGEPPAVTRDTAGRWRLNMQSPTLRRHLQEASCDMIGVLLDAGYLREARDMYERAVVIYRVPADMLAKYVPRLQLPR